MLCAILLTGCNNKSVPYIEPIETFATTTLYSNSIYKEPFSFFTVYNEYVTSLYEPKHGVLLGAYILSSRHVNYDIAKFEKIVARPHALYTHKMKLGDPFPETWLLQCISLMKTPNIILTHSNGANPFDINKVKETAKKFGGFNVPIFLHFFPEQIQHGYNPEEYVLFFREARKIFKVYAPNVAFVWSIFEDDVLDSTPFYPGDDYVDWVGINMYKNIIDAHTPFKQNTFSRLNAFYHTHHKNKPIMISQFGVSHFSTINHIYHPTLAGQAIKNFYQKILNHYPRVKAVVYTDINTINNPTHLNYKDNFSVTSNPIILDFYKCAIQDERFLSYLLPNSGGKVVPQLIKSPFNAYKINNNFYVSQNTLIYDLGKNDLSYFYNYKVKIDGYAYYNICMFKNSNTYNISINNSLNKIILG